MRNFNIEDILLNNENGMTFSAKNFFKYKKQEDYLNFINSIISYYQQNNNSNLTNSLHYIFDSSINYLSKEKKLDVNTSYLLDDILENDKKSLPHLIIKYFHDPEFMDTLINNNLKVDDTSHNERKNSYMIMAILNKNINVYKLLLEKGANPYIPNILNESALKILAEYNMDMFNKTIEDRKITKDLFNKEEIERLSYVIDSLSFKKRFHEMFNILEKLNMLELFKTKAFDKAVITCISNFYNNKNIDFNKMFELGLDKNYKDQHKGNLFHILTNIVSSSIDYADQKNDKEKLKKENFKEITMLFLKRGVEPNYLNEFQEKPEDYLNEEYKNIFKTTTIEYEKDVLLNKINSNISFDNNKLNDKIRRRI